MITVPELAADALGEFLATYMRRRFGSSQAHLVEMVPSIARIAGQSRTRCFHANGSAIRNASVQRMKDSVTGGICPAARRPTMALPAQNSVAIQSSR